MISRRGLMSAGLASSLPAWAQGAGHRVALVIGNAAYAAAPLPNAANDAKAMSAALRSMGFEVIEVRDAGKRRMEEAIALSRSMLQGRSGVGLLYYAGHGLQVDWRNYMVPVDAVMESAADVPRASVDIQGAIDAFRAAGNRMNIVVLDACRDNPFGSAATGKGLAPLDAPPGTFLAYATAPGYVAEDGSGTDGNGLFTRYLLKEMQQPQAKIEDLFKRVRLQVRQASQGRQIPWESTSLEEDFVFSTGGRASAATGAGREAEFQAELADWDRVKDTSRPEDLYAFLQRHPNGRISEMAQFRLDQLSRPTVQAVQPLRVLPPGVDRFRVGDSWALQRTNHLKAGAVREVREAVTAIEGRRVLVNNGETVLDQMGGVVVNRFGTKNPALVMAPADLQVGKRWRSAFTNTLPSGTQGRNFYDHRCVALEELEVPAGRFKAFRIESQGESVQPTLTLELNVVLWVDPASMMELRQDVKLRSKERNTLIEHSSDVLLWRKQVPRG